MSALSIKEFEEQLAASKLLTDKFQKQLDARNKVSDAQLAQDEQDVRTAQIVLEAMSQIPIPKDGKDGNDADPVDYNIIHDFIDTAVSAIPIPNDGKDGRHGDNGKDGYTPIKGKDYRDGVDGKDADEVAITKTLTKHIESKTEEVKQHISKLVKEDPSFIGPKGEAGKNGIDGHDGTDGVDGINGKDGVDGTNGINGKDGINGINGIDGIDGKDGMKGDRGDPGRDGKQGKDGRHGKDGKQGKDGVGIKNIYTDGPSLKVHMTDGVTKTLALPRAQGTHAGKVSPIAIPEVQNAMRTPISAAGISATNVRDALVEVKNKIVQSSSGNPFDVGTSEAFMFDYNPYDETHDGSLNYNDSNQLINKTIETHTGTVLYTVTFNYNGNQLSSKTILDNINTDSVTITYNYDEKSRLIGKVHTYTA